MKFISYDNYHLVQYRVILDDSPDVDCMLTGNLSLCFASLKVLVSV